MPKPMLHEIVALVNGRKGEAEKAVKAIYHLFDKPTVFDGLTRTYRPREENGEPQPPENVNPQQRVKDLIGDICGTWTDLFDLTFTLDVGNGQARADVEVDGKVLAKDVPAVTLLFLHKRLEEVKALVARMPTPDPAENWAYDEKQDLLVTGERQTVRTKKIQRSLVLIQPTKEHPGQAQMITEDVAAGDWTAVGRTTRIPAARRNEMLERVNKLLDAVKVARERANSIEVEKRRIGNDLFGYVFGELTRTSNRNGHA